MEGDPIMEELDPRLRKFVWNLNTACNFEEVTGRSVSEINIGSNRDLRALIFAGIRDDVPGITEKDVGRAITSRNLQQVMAFVRERMAEGEPSKNG